MLHCDESRTGLCEGDCMLMSVRIERFSASYELSAIVLPCDASRNAAIQSAYCFSCNHNNLSVYVVGGEGESVHARSQS